MAASTPHDLTERIRYRLRVSLLESEPEIWRLVDVDGSLALDELHTVLQLAMGWQNSHLHEFTELNPHDGRHGLPTIGREPLHWSMESDDDDPGLPEAEWTVAGVYADLTGPLYYSYDFGDGWTHRVELIETGQYGADEPGAASAPRAVLVRGERRGPLEDSGGPHGYAEVLEALNDPEHERYDDLREWVDVILGSWRNLDPNALDVDAVNQSLRLELGSLADAAVSDAWAATEAAHPDRPTTIFDVTLGRVPIALRKSLLRRAQRGTALDAAVIAPADAARMVEPFVWLMRRAGTDGIALSKAGWMPPVVVSDAMRELGWKNRWHGKFNREELTMPVANLRASAVQFKLLRKYKGRLLLTVAAKRLLGDPVALWHYLAQALVQNQRSEAERDAVVLFALEVASARYESFGDYAEPIGKSMRALGWAIDGQPMGEYDVIGLIRDSYHTFHDLGVLSRGRLGSSTVTDAGRAFVRAMLQIPAVHVEVP
ncbi:plasmid pRiA4b ORF-3 family protein [Glaciibacter psychrotolerans]|uniref:Plasmid pRiA4b Orf3-like domain-containing protein n=1 Tax=Glaciibacter psychrotolerans TaxID=670054 RepID=A0A7Z0ECD8_9MICO|nr:plasmid pRiA4b ORF-3 family protein [Leifsonia psychrotolerans]NYJ19068.1 hypothetical protein [Leifsonia psychrotolerans]